MKWIRTCQECGHKQEDNKPSSIKELTVAYRMRTCRQCKSEALDYGSEVFEPHEIYADHPKCDACGKIPHAVADGYAFGDRLLEGVKFFVTLSETGVVAATTDPESASYMKDLNEPKWLKEAAKFAAETDTLECPTCGGDIDGFGVIGAPVRVEE